MDFKLEARIDAPASAVLAEVADLAAYPEWHGMVQGVEADGDGWLVDLGGRLGPLKHTKRVRLVRGDDEVPGHVRFVRSERDGQEHGAWELDAEVHPPTGEGPCTLHFCLSYNGSSPLVGLLEPLLRAETERSADRLRQRLAAV